MSVVDRTRDSNMFCVVLSYLAGSWSLPHGSDRSQSLPPEPTEDAKEEDSDEEAEEESEEEEEEEEGDDSDEAYEVEEVEDEAKNSASVLALQQPLPISLHFVLDHINSTERCP